MVNEALHLNSVPRRRRHARQRPSRHRHVCRVNCHTQASKASGQQVFACVFQDRWGRL